LFRAGEDKKIKMNITKRIFVLAFILLISNYVYPQFGKRLDLVKIKAYQSFDKVIPGTEFKIAAKINIDPQWHINSNKPYEDFLIPSVLSVDTTTGFNLYKIKYPVSHDRKLAFSDKPLSVYENEIYIGALVMSPAKLKPGTYRLAVTFDYQSCNDKTCLPPNKALDTLSIELAAKDAVVKEINQDIFKNVNQTASLTNTDQNDNSISSRLEKSGLLLSLIFVFIGL